jgi:hypothetical protein
MSVAEHILVSWLILPEIGKIGPEIFHKCIYSKNSSQNHRYFLTVQNNAFPTS